MFLLLFSNVGLPRLLAALLLVLRPVSPFCAAIRAPGTAVELPAQAVEHGGALGTIADSRRRLEVEEAQRVPHDRVTQIPDQRTSVERPLGVHSKDACPQM